ncbi:MAG: hypothetical protein AB1776_03925 [Bacillota bacterium]
MTLQALDDHDNQVWSQTATVKIAQISAGKLTAKAADPKKISGAGLAVAVADITIEENEPGVFRGDGAGLDPDDTITLTIKTDGVTWVDLCALDPSGTAGLDAGAASRVDDKTLQFTITSQSAGIGGKLTFDLDITGYLNVAPNVSGDIVITVSSSNTNLSDTDLVVATTTAGEFTVKAKDTKDREGVPGQVNLTIGDLEIEQNFVGAYKSNGSLVFTLKNAKWNATSWNAFTAPGGFTKGSRYNDDRSIWLSVSGSPAKTVTFDLPAVDLDATASGDIIVEVSGTAGPSGEYLPGERSPLKGTVVAGRGIIRDAGGQLITRKGRRELAAKLGVGERTLTTIVSELVREGVLSVYTRRLGRGRGAETTYSMVPAEKAASGANDKEAKNAANVISLFFCRAGAIFPAPARQALGPNPQAFARAGPGPPFITRSNR